MRALPMFMVLFFMFTLCCAAHAFAARPNRKFPEKEYANALERELIEASFHGNIDKVKACVAKGARIDARYGGTAKYFKSADGGWPVAGFNWTALMAATGSDRFAIIEFLSANGASVRMDDGWGATPLYALADKRTLRKEWRQPQCENRHLYRRSR